jgi:dimethylaniline monooxygenase (N-oxide forming)
MKVCVIGAGPAGLTTIKQLLDEGHEVVCFERQSNIGGLWYRHEDDAAEIKAYDELILSISMKLMSFSDFIYSGERRFENHKGYLKYLQAYAAKFGLNAHIRFNTAVKSVRKDGDEWLVTVQTDGASSEQKFGAVAVCTGPFRTPNTSTVEHLDRFSGEVIHSSRYRNNGRFRDKKVLVVGLAESGADILREVSNVSAKCTLSVRSHTFLIPRLTDGKHATDNLTVRAHHYEMYLRSTETPFPMSAIFEDEHCSRERFLEVTRLYGMMFLAQQAVRRDAGGGAEAAPADGANPLGVPSRPLHLDVDTEMTKDVIDFINDWNRKSHRGERTYSPKIIFCKNASFVPNILKGKIRVDDTGIAGIQGNSVRFQSGAVEEFDAIVLCTGFQTDFSLLENVEIPDNNVRNLYKHAFPPDHAGRLAVIGVVRPFTGGIPICAEMQARYFARLCSGKLDLPADVHERIEREKAWEEIFTEYSPRCFDAIPSQIFFCDSIAAEIGCLPKASELINDPELLVKLWFNSFNQVAYRLTGPHAMPDEARTELVKLELPISSIGFVAAMLMLSAAPRAHHLDHNEIPPPAKLPMELLGPLEAVLRSTAQHAVTGRAS